MTLGFVVLLTLAVVASFLGAELARRAIKRVSTPPFAGLHAIVGVTVVAAVLIAGRGESRIAAVLGFVAVLLGTTGVVAGFLIADRLHRDAGEGVPEP